ncbi:hypothetical protein VZT92_026908 [Zoarces viviparus]|uniref:Uncharacterized protein n=1 Tax=Zoarces viviparus TaxID=48416 RepID=A0AAW1DSE7_ZOAVI
MNASFAAKSERSEAYNLEPRRGGEIWHRRVWRAAQVGAEVSRGEFDSLTAPMKLLQESPRVDDAARFVRGAGSGAFKAGKHPPSSR